MGSGGSVLNSGVNLQNIYYAKCSPEVSRDQIHIDHTIRYAPFLPPIMVDAHNKARATAANLVYKRGVMWPSVVNTLALLCTIAMLAVSPKTTALDVVFSMLVLTHLRVLYWHTRAMSFCPMPSLRRDTPAENVLMVRGRGDASIFSFLGYFLFGLVFPIVGVAFGVVYASDEDHSPVERALPLLAMFLMIASQNMFLMLVSSVYEAVDADSGLDVVAAAMGGANA